MPRIAPQTQLRAAAIAVAVFGIGLSIWLVDKAILNPDVHAKQPRWYVDGMLNLPYWLPLILTVTVGAGCVIWIYLRAASRLRSGEDLVAGSYRDRQRRGTAGF
jgi:hypothetical protein